MKQNQALKVSTDTALQALCEAIACIKTAAEARQFFQDLCTPTELQAIVDRWRVVKLLKKGESYRKICEKTKVSVTTIGRVARCMMLGEGGYNLIYERLEKKSNANRNSPKRRNNKE